MNKKNGIIVYLTYRYPELYRCFENEAHDSTIIRILKKWISKQLTEVEENREARNWDYLIYNKKQEIQNHAYGEKASIIWKELTEAQQNEIAFGLLRQQSGESRELFCEILLAILHKGEIFTNKQFPEQLSVYLGTPRTQKENRLIELVAFFFLPFGQKLKIYWEEPFFVMGEDRCNVLGWSKLC